jgi:hypothetical protein
MLPSHTAVLRMYQFSHYANGRDDGYVALLLTETFAFVSLLRMSQTVLPLVGAWSLDSTGPDNARHASRVWPEPGL